MAYSVEADVKKEAGLTANTTLLSADYTAVIAEADDAINLALNIAGTATPLSTVPPTIAKISRWYAAGLLMVREYGVQVIGDQLVNSGANKIKQAEKWLKEYCDGITAKQAEDNQYATPRASEDKRVFQEYNNGAWGPAGKSPVRVNRAN